MTRTAIFPRTATGRTVQKDTAERELLTASQWRIIVFMAWLCVVVNGACLAACLYSDHLAEEAGISVERIIKNAR